MTTSTIKAVIDTNVLVSGLLGSSLSRAIVQAWLDGRFTLVLSSQLVDELQDVLSRPKLARYIDSQMQRILLSSFITHAEFIIPAEDINLCRDPKDNIFLSAAASGHVNYLVTRDNDFLDDDALKLTMHNQYGVGIITPVDFKALLR